ncbi:MAG TPA: tetratricopeptide repeat protein [Archangium sp.]|jgi:tetratricopeptide (TPR) repeat protein|uniref:tetratricopeptide repeat protein n=1 Tax=Archangium sp. TaxID=1872627 RepID=UPI002ED8D29F
MRSILLALFVVLSLPALAATPEELSAWDALYAKRGDSAALKQLDEALGQALKATPEDFEVLWRVARLRQWQADGSTDAKVKKNLGKQSWELGDKARKLSPERVEGHFFAAAGIGLYSQAVGILTALGEGLEGKYNERLDTALKIDAMYERGGPLVLKGRYFYELPWPKRDLKKSASFFQKALARHPEQLRARLYLAETLLADGEEKQAHETILKVTQGSVGYDPAEGQRVQGWAKKVQAAIEEELK